MTPSHFGFVDYDKGVDEVGQLFAAGCDADASCAQHMGGPALDKTRATFEKLRTTPCNGIDRVAARTYAAIFMGDWYMRQWIFPMVHRLDRCSADDQSTLTHFLTAVNQAFSSPSGGAPDSPDNPEYRSSGILQYNIVLSELWTRSGQAEPTKAALQAAADAQTFLSVESYPASIIDLRATWPLPPSDHADLKVPVATSIPLLWLAGGLDTRTPPSQSKEVASLYPDQPFVLLAGAAHTPSQGSPIAGTTDNCGTLIIEKFVQTAKVDTSCKATLAPVLYEASSEAIAQKFWGTTDDWGDGKAKAKANRSAIPSAERAFDPKNVALSTQLALRAAASRFRAMH
jgi:pimeloyl-ACP methyl ester carboxylesterase